MSKRAEILKQRIRDRLEELGWEQGDLAKALGTHQSAISRYLSGHHIPKLDFLERIAAALKVTPEALISLEQAATPVAVREPTPEELAVHVIKGLKVEKRRADLATLILTCDPLALESLEAAAVPFRRSRVNKNQSSVG